ncbi:RidA family protein [Mycoplasma capricolum]|uniref:Endoribonuclease L-PSP n=1 Tax=Mycoplasma capricolum subsp. capripneumoniae 87001 TaxID=1124992 RepID=A0A9N7G9P6_MYCCC|nr:RidA family protein [Mycoplasma capricolum]AJK51773.1 endoribonuclease L-PSP [Mycoplasma capricolum subsp. capripneumoniae 87001]AQU77709.1 reactive intermediate/imine deaminase [Mycoplasma capricolum subsp. capripneumoniae]QIN43319.1 RidA family protein [Mycoplasma capricolum subsp. capripneumoniae]QIN44001.1 RidA family protein [Mycoplasma capricolum subsp. capripneumoniae]QIN44687.1 RidA family protein [Mycoplasma capricolum subsp. capripneumoniae]
MKIVSTENAPKAIGPYSQAVKICNGTLYLSGQLGLDPKTMLLENNIELQTKRSLNNIYEILKQAGYQKTDVVKTLVLLKDINDFSLVNSIYEEFFEEHKPARSAFQAAALPKDALIEIEVIAYKTNTTCCLDK